MNSVRIKQPIIFPGESSSELFQLDEIDRKVFFWLIDHVKLKAIRSWLEVIREDYGRRYSIVLNTECLFAEAK